jgi:hypothetical protein
MFANIFQEERTNMFAALPQFAHSYPFDPEGRLEVFL